MTEDKPTETVVAAQEEPKVEEVEAPVANKYVNPERELTQGERKCRKALQKLGLKECDGFTRITLKKRDGVIFVMNDPDVFKSSENSYVAFGELKIEDPNQRAHDAAAQKFQEEQKASIMSSMSKSAEKPAEAKAEVSNEAAENEEGLTASHIDMVMNHASCSRNEAVRALRAANDDMIAAVMQLTQ